MDIIAARAILSAFLNDPARSQDCFSPAKFEGAFSALYSSPEYINDLDILLLALPEDEVGLNALLDESSELFAAVDLIFETLALELEAGEFRLHERYAVEACGESFKPSAELCDWIEGYLTVFSIALPHWEAACDEMAQEEGLEEVSEKLRLDVDSATSLMAAIHTPDIAFDSPEQAAAMMADLPQLLPTLADSVAYMFKMGSMLQEQAIERDTEGFDDAGQETELTQAPDPSQAQVGRNDPCICGSGKKYKKCCLN